jgi:hypothetical protein
MICNIVSADRTYVISRQLKEEVSIYRQLMFHLFKSAICFNNSKGTMQMH